MIYYQDSEVIIRDLQESDAQIITDGEIAQGWVYQYLYRLKMGRICRVWVSGNC